MKKWQGMMTTGAVLITALMLTACGGGTKKAANASTGDNAVKVVSGTYIVPEDSNAANGYKYLALNVSIKSNAGSKESFSSNNFTLRTKGGSKINAEYADSSDDESFKALGSEKLNQGEKVKGYIVFKVKPKTKYTLEFAPYATDGKDIDESKLAVNTGKYPDNTEAGQQALKAYVDNIFMGLEDTDYKALVGNDEAAERKTFAASVRSYFEKHVVNSTLTDKAFTTVLKQLQAANVKAGGAKYQVEYAYPSKVKIEVTPTVYDLDDMYDVIDAIQDQLEEKYPDADYDKIQLYAKAFVVEHFDQVLAKMKPTTADNGNSIELVKTKGKWTIDTSTDDYEYFAEPFTGNNY